MHPFKAFYQRARAAYDADPRFGFDEQRQKCCYRSPNGAKCLIGHLIADEHYHEEIENCAIINSPSVIKAVLASNTDIPLYNVPEYELQYFLGRLQIAHDHAVGMKELTIDFSHFEKQFAAELA